MEGLELAARVSQCGMTPPLHEQFRHRSQPVCFWEDFRSPPSLAGVWQNHGWSVFPGSPSPAEGWGLQAGHTVRKGRAGPGVLPWIGDGGMGWHTSPWAAARDAAGDAVSLGILCGLVPLCSSGVCSPHIRDIGGDVPV